MQAQRHLQKPAPGEPSTQGGIAQTLEPFWASSLAVWRALLVSRNVLSPMAHRAAAGKRMRETVPRWVLQERRAALPSKFSHPLGGLSLVNICVTEMCVGRGGKWIKLNCVLITFQRLSDQPFPMVKLAKPLKALAVFRVQTHRSLKGLRRRVILLL